MNSPRPASPTVFLLLAANLVPLAGALLWGWKVFDILLLYWIENLIIGGFNAFKMISVIALRGRWIAFPIVPFFIFHYGIFCLAHGAFVFALFAPQPPQDGVPVQNYMDNIVGDLIAQPMFLIAVCSLLFSHAFSFLFHFMIRREVYKTDLITLMGAPYGRIMVMHITILLGASLVLLLREPIWALALMTLLKTILDLKAHRRSHQKLQENEETAPAATDDAAP